MDSPLMSQTLQTIHGRLLDRYGSQHWWPADEPFEVMVGAILTQSTAWTNVDKAMVSLKAAGALSPAAMRRLPHDELAALVYSSGYYNAKAWKLKALAEWLGDRCRDDLDAQAALDPWQLRRELLGVHGIGEETADSIMLYACHRPVFVIDAYTRRIVDRIGFAPGGSSYADYQRLFMDNLPADAPLFNEYHALLVCLGKNECRPRPLCQQCCLGVHICQFCGNN